MGCHGSGAYSAGGTNNLQKSAYESINAKLAEIEQLKEESKPLQEDINRIKEDIREPGAFTDVEREKQWLAEFEQMMKEDFTDKIKELENDIKEIKKAGRKENKGQLTFFSMRNSK